MLPPYQLMPYFESLAGLDKNRTEACYRALNEAGLMNYSSGRGKARQSIGSEHLIRWLLAIGSDKPIRNGEAVEAMHTLWHLENENGQKAGDVLSRWIENFKNVKSGRFEYELAKLVIRSRVQIDIDTPRIRTFIELPDGSNVETIFGPQVASWKDSNVTKSVTIPGRVWFNLAMMLHFNDTRLIAA